jgi:hypothetical protein
MPDLLEHVENGIAAPTQRRARPPRVPDEGRDEMKYMIMMFGEAASMLETRSREWIEEMIGFMKQIDKDLADSGELVFQQGLADGSTAKTVRLTNGVPVATDGPFAEARESLVGYWVVAVDSETRVIELAGQIAEYAGTVEVRQAMDAPPEM